MYKVFIKLKGLFSRPKAQDFQSRAKLSLSVFQKTVEELQQLNEEAVDQEVYHKKRIEESNKELGELSVIVSKNNKIIEKINDILS